jgi:predicted ATPase/DNA-binding winged helix-turn-helix (wHTH) protein
MRAPANTREIFSFGPFILVPGERVLTRGGHPVELGGRGLDLLMALLSRANEVIGKRELLAQVWPEAIVEEGSLRFHIAGLRKALGDGTEGARYITTVAGRGYCFVAPVVRSTDREPPPSFSTVPHVNLPSRLLRMVGRARDTELLAKQLAAERFVTIVGSGGVGKTTVAVAVGHDLVEAFAGAVAFVDLGAISDPRLVSTTLATLLGLSVQSEDATPNLIAYLRDRRILLILDTCEHLIDAVAELASRLFDAASQVHILATSREALRVEGEHVYKLGPLDFPPETPHLTADVAQTFTAIQLFVERARASGARLDFNDDEAAVVASICRKLDGVALAIELAAGRVHTYGLQRTAALLDERLTLQWPGQRTAPPRQRTLQATLDWSYEILTDSERAVLRRLAVFVGYFTFEAALQVARCDTIDEDQVFRALESLIDKSMVATQPLGAMMRYRLLDTTRAYALQVSTNDSEHAELAARHASYYHRWLGQTGTEWLGLSNAAERAPHLAALGNVRAALGWCFASNGDTQIGISLAAAAAPVFLAMSLLTECHRWSERALAAFDDKTRGGIEEMRLQASLGMSLMFTRNHGDIACVAFDRSLAIAEEQGDRANQLLLLGPLHMFHFRRGEYKSSLQYARRSAVAAAEIADRSAIALAHCLAGISLHSMGELSSARAEIEASLRFGPAPQRRRTINLGFDYYNWAGMALGRILWMQGHPAQAIERVQQTVRDAERLGHPVTLTIVLHWAVALYLWLGDLDAAEAHVDWFLSCAELHSLGPYLAVGHGLQGELAIRRGNAERGVEMLENALEKLHAARYELVTTAFNIALAKGLAATGRADEAIGRTDETIRQVEENGDFALMPELLRVKGRLLLSTSPANPTQAEACLVQSLDWARRQSARSWELRTATDLASLLMEQQDHQRALDLLTPVFARFTEGHDTADLKDARRVLAALGQ